jgi:PAS domain S-box-containing protein
MDDVSTDLSALAPVLYNRCETIAMDWQRAISPTASVPLSESEVHRRLLELTRLAIHVLLSEPFDPVPAQDIGKALAELQYVQPETCQVTTTVLSARLTENLTATQIAALHPRLIALCGELTVGLMRQVRQALLDEQEQIRQTLADERRRAEEQIREMNKALVRRILDRTEQLERANQDLEREIAARRRILETLQDTTRALQTLIQASPLAIVATDSSGSVKIWNPAAERMFGWTADQVLGHPLPIIPLDKQDEYRILCEAAKQGEGFSNIEVRRQRKDGTLIDISVSSAGLYDVRGDLTGFVAIMADITARKQSEVTLRRYAIELQSRNEELDAFAHTVAHDLKSPLSNLVGYADAFRLDYSGLSDEERQVSFNFMLQSAQKMDNIIDELLLLAGVRRTTVKPLPLDMTSIVGEACKRLSYLVAKYKAEIVSLDASAWPVALGHAPWVEEVWVNYISNALKYGGMPPEAPRVELGGEAFSDDRVRFWVRDHGPGLTPDQQARLFTPFTQLNQVRARGHGLGLSIVRRIVEKLGGQVGVESSGVPGEGCLFYFTLPRNGD